MQISKLTRDLGSKSFRKRLVKKNDYKSFKLMQGSQNELEKFQMPLKSNTTLLQ